MNCHQYTLKCRRNYNCAKREPNKRVCLAGTQAMSAKKNIALVWYWTVFLTASKWLNLNNPILSDRRERSVGSKKLLLHSVLKGRNNEESWQNSVILYTLL